MILRRMIYNVHSFPWCISKEDLVVYNIGNTIWYTFSGNCYVDPRHYEWFDFYRSGTKWAHVNCALWIPEVSIGCVEKMEPITKISQIPVRPIPKKLSWKKLIPVKKANGVSDGCGTNILCFVWQASRWSLICCLCKERCGACIQCSVKACKTAFHVSCAFQNNLEMKTILTDDLADDGGVKLKVGFKSGAQNFLSMICIFL